ncbi:MAG: hypothetical protein LBM08_00430, partial [Dysgonamonadaceae bacterium]|nr:hypothetical protein [Dysgonamonadaceae bacterium]
MNTTFPKYLFSFFGVFILPTASIAQAPGQPATPFTRQINEEEYRRLDFADSTDYRDATKGFIAPPESDVILNDRGAPAASLKQYDFIRGDAPETV